MNFKKFKLFCIVSLYRMHYIWEKNVNRWQFEKNLFSFVKIYIDWLKFKKMFYEPHINST